MLSFTITKLKFKGNENFRYTFDATLNVTDCFKKDVKDYFSETLLEECPVLPYSKTCTIAMNIYEKSITNFVSSSDSEPGCNFETPDMFFN